MDDAAFIYLLLANLFQWLALGLVLRRLGKLESRERQLWDELKWLR